MMESVFRKRFLIALFNFLIVAAVGTLLRFVFVHEVEIVAEYKNVLHAHSHVAIMGWVFMALFGSLLFAFTPDASNRKLYHVLFWINQINCLVLIVNFWIHGYDIVSIVLSSIYILITYIFSANILKDLKNSNASGIAKMLLKFCLFFLVISTIGILALGPVLMTLHGTEKVIWYYLLVQFYIHFQYNGWFIFGCLALFFSFYKNNSTENKVVLYPVYGIAFATITTYCLSIFWGFPAYHIFLNISVASGFVQLFFTIQLFRLNKNIVKEIFYKLKSGVKALFIISFSALIIKQLLQVIIIYPEMAHASFVLRNYVIAYLHLTFLGVTTIFLLGYAWQNNALLIQSKVAKIVIGIIVCSVFSIELLLSIMGSLSWAGISSGAIFYQLVFAFSLAIVLCLLIILVKNLNKKLY